MPRSLILAALMAATSITSVQAQVAPDRREARQARETRAEREVGPERPRRTGPDGEPMQRGGLWSGPARVRAPTDDVVQREDRPQRQDRPRFEVPTQPAVQAQPPVDGSADRAGGWRRRDNRDGPSGVNRVIERGDPALREQRRVERGGFGGGFGGAGGRPDEREARRDWRGDRQPQPPAGSPYGSGRDRRGDDGLIEHRRDDRRVEVGRGGSGQGYGWSNRQGQAYSSGYGQGYGDDRRGHGQVLGGGYRRDDRRVDTRNFGTWSRDWRRDGRYDWQRYRYDNRDRFDVGRYQAPYGWGFGYRRFTVGIALSTVLFDQRYWIDDPYEYRLPEAYGSYRWVRYYDDVLLVDLRSGQVVDAIYDFFE